MNLYNISSLVIYCLSVFAGSVLIVSWLQQGIVVGQAWLGTQVYIHRTTSSGEFDVSEIDQCYHYQ